MVLSPRRRSAFAFFLASALGAQQPSAGPTAPKFDVVSIRAVPPDTPPVLRDIDFTPILPGGQYIDSRTGLLPMIAFAYNVKSPSMQLLGLPNWAKNQSFMVSAKPAEGFPALSPAENREQVRLMLRAMLADRFHLRVRTETREEQVFHLEVAKGGIKIQEVDPPVPPDKPAPVGAAMGDDGGRMIGQKSTIASLASVLTLFLKRLVVDQTGLKGFYDFDIKWSAPEARPAAPGFGPEGAALLISALQKQLGLHLATAPGSVEYWVIDHVEPPTDN